MSLRHKRRQLKTQIEDETTTEPDNSLHESTKVLEPQIPIPELTDDAPAIVHEQAISFPIGVVATECPPPVPPVPENEKEEVVEKKTKRKRKAKIEASSGSDGIPTAAPPSKKSKKDQLIEDFMITQLPALRKEIKLRKKEQNNFNIRDYPEYFKPGGAYLPTYCLSLFNFLGKNELVCSQYGVFDRSRHMVKTNEGFNHASLIISSMGDTISPDESEHMIKRFGREWFKIPAKDASRVATAFRFGDGHQFKVILTGVYKDSFFGEDGEEVLTVNPVLRYEPVRGTTPKVKKEKKLSESAPELVVDQPSVESLDEIL